VPDDSLSRVTLTPAAFLEAVAARLRETVERKRAHASEVEEARLLSQSRELRGQLPALRAPLGRWRLAAVVLAVAWLATLLWLLLRG
jgi:hypothetical protein